MKSTNAFTDLEHLQLVASRIVQDGIDITRDYPDWVRVTFACASLGEAAREPYQDICRFYPRYTREECDEKFDNCLRTGRGDITLGTLMELAKRHGIDVSLPKGRRPKTAEQKEQEEKDRFKQICEWLNDHYEFRCNTITEQTEARAKSTDAEWKEMDDRQLNSLLTELHADKVPVSKANLETYICSETFSPAYNPVVDYARSLPDWKPKHKDYIADMFEHLGMASDDDRDFLLQMAKRWFVWMVAVAIEQDTKNELMLILSGERESTGKTFFVLQFLPKPMRRYIYNLTQLSNFKDKDEVLALSRNIVYLVDEIKVSLPMLNKLKNYVGGASASTTTERSPYGHFAVCRRVHASWVATTNEQVFLPDSTGDRRFVVLPIIERGKDYKSINQERAFAQAYYLATHPKAFPLGITTEETEKLKEINQKYVQQDLLTALLPTVLRQPKEGEQAQAATTGEIIGWLTSRNGPNRDFTPTKVGIAMKKLGYVAIKTNAGKQYLVVRVFLEDLTQEGKVVANQILGM